MDPAVTAEGATAGTEAAAVDPAAVAAAEVAVGDAATPVEGAASVPVVEKTAEELAAEADAQKVADAKFAAELPALIEKIPEADRRRLALKYANGTMAAARRAERAVETVKAENAQLKAKLAAGDPRPSFRKDVKAWMAAEGFTTVRELVDHIAGNGADQKPDPLDEVGKLRKELQDQRDAEKAAEAAVVSERSRAAVAAAVDADKARFARVATPTGKARLWGEIQAYWSEHGSCPDAAVFKLADLLERELRTEFGDPAPRPAARVASASGAGAPGASASAGSPTITSKGASGAPVVRKYSLDPDERRAQVTADMLANGELHRGAAQG